MKSLNTKIVKDALSKIKPAISNDGFIEVLSNFCFLKDLVYAYNDVLSIRMPLDGIDFELGVNGDIFYKLLSSLKSKEFNLEKEGKNLKILSGKSKLKIPFIEKEKYILNIEKIDKKTPCIDLNKEVLSGINRCMVSVSDDLVFPGRMGLSFNSDGKYLYVFSTNGVTISLFKIKSKVKAFKRVVIPKDFCNQLISLGKDLKRVKLFIHENHVGASSDSLFNGMYYFLHSKLNFTGESLDFEGVLKRLDIKKELFCKIPKSFISSLERSLILQSNSSSKLVVADLKGKDVLLLNTDSDLGSVKDKIVFKDCDKIFSELKGLEKLQLITDQTLIGSKNNTHLSFNKKCILFKTGKYYKFFVAYSSMKSA